MPRTLTTLLATSLPLLTLAVSFRNRQFILRTRNLPWYVGVVQPKIILVLNRAFLQLFGWDLESLWQTANKQQCVALIRAGRLGEALESYLSMMNASDETAKASLRAWFSSQSFSHISHDIPTASHSALG
jgi:hypothetical protein